MPGSRAGRPQGVRFTVPQRLTSAQQQIARNNIGATLAGFMFGLTMSTAGSSTTMSIAAGAAADSAGLSLISIGAFSKTTSVWAVGTGNGGLDTGSIANSTWYHFFLIEPSAGMGGAPDIVFSATSTPASGPTRMPAGYGPYRRIGSGMTNGSAQWTSFTQNGDEFLWLVGFHDINSSAFTTTATLVTMTTPLNIVTNALFSGWAENAATTYLYISSPAVTDIAPSGATQFTCALAAGLVLPLGMMNVRTSASAQIRIRTDTSATTVTATTLGWIDTRGRLA